MDNLRTTIDLAKKHNTPTLLSYLVFPNGKVSEYMRLIEPVAFTQDSLIKFFQEDEWYAHMRYVVEIYDENGNSRE
jgi:hypothetical protein